MQKCHEFYQISFITQRKELHKNRNFEADLKWNFVSSSQSIIMTWLSEFRRHFGLHFNGNSARTRNLFLNRDKFTLERDVSKARDVAGLKALKISSNVCRPKCVSGKFNEQWRAIRTININKRIILMTLLEDIASGLLSAWRDKTTWWLELQTRMICNQFQSNFCWELLEIPEKVWISSNQLSDQKDF